MGTLSIATWNVNSLRVRLPQLAEWLATAKPDVVALQETKTTDADFPVAEIEALGYQVAFAGQRTYNGVAVLSREPLRTLATDIPGFPDEQRRVLAVETAGLTVLDLYVPNGQAPGSDMEPYNRCKKPMLSAPPKSCAIRFHPVKNGTFLIGKDHHERPTN